MGNRENEQRFRDLYHRHHPSITAYFARRIGIERAKDATDDVFLVAWRRIDRTPENGEELPWLYGVARNVLANHLRTERRRTRLLARVAGLRNLGPLDPEPQVVREAENRRVVEALSALRAEDQELLMLSYWEGLTHAEIGTMLNCSKSAVDARFHRILNRLRKALDRAELQEHPPAYRVHPTREEA